LLVYNGSTNEWIAKSMNGDATISNIGTVVVQAIHEKPIVAGATDAQFLSYNGTTNMWAPASFGGDATVSNIGTVVLRTVGIPSSYVSVSTDENGRVTSGSTTITAGGLPDLPQTRLWLGNASNVPVA